MDGPDLADELDRARDTLSVAYERARAIGYQPDSRQMLELHLAEQHYEHLKDKRYPGATATDQGDGRDVGTSGGATDEAVCGTSPSSQVIDLRDAAAARGRCRGL